MSTEINKGEWRRSPTHITLTRESCSRITPSSNHGRVYRLVIFSRGNLPYTQSFPAEADQGACPLGFSHLSRITRAHRVDRLEIETFLAWKDHSGMVYDYLLCVIREMKAGLRA